MIGKTYSFILIFCLVLCLIGQGLVVRGENNLGYEMGGTVKIVALNYKVPESITIKSMVDFDIVFAKNGSDKSKIVLKVVGVETPKYLKETLIAGEERSFESSNAFSDKGGCVSVWSGEVEISNKWCWGGEVNTGNNGENEEGNSHEGNNIGGDERGSENGNKGNCEEVNGGVLFVSEIFGGNGKIAPYVEMMILEDLAGRFEALEVAGSVVKNIVRVEINKHHLEKNARLILTNSMENLSENMTLTVGYQSEFYLNLDGGELEIWGTNGQDRQLLDKVVVVTGQEGKSLYSSDEKYAGCRQMGKVDNFSPGFDEGLLKYFEDMMKTEIKYMEAPIKESISSIEGSGNDENEIEKAGTGVWIENINYLSPESITLRSELGVDIDFTKKKRYLKSNTASTKKYIDGVLSGLSTSTFVKNFGFPDGGACISLWSGDVKMDEKCYEPPKASGGGGGQILDYRDETQGYKLEIVDIVYDPEGTDTNNEKITLHNIGWETIDLSKLKMQISGNSTSNKKLTGTLFPQETNTLQGTFSFPNSTKDGSDVSVKILAGERSLAEWFYQPNKTLDSGCKTQGSGCENEDDISWYEGLEFSIEELVYNPEGSDKDNEVVVVKILDFRGKTLDDEAVTGIDFGKLSLEVGPWEEYGTGTWKTKSLKKFGIFGLDSLFRSEGQLLNLTGDWQMPNSKPSCVRLMEGEVMLAEKCYNPGEEEDEEEKDSSLRSEGRDGDSLKGAIRVVSILPNPKGADGENEEVVISCENLDGVYLLINGKTKKKLDSNTKILRSAQNDNYIEIKGNLGLPNTASCVELMNAKGISLDTFCYPKAEDGVRYYQNNKAVQEIGSDELGIVKGISLVKQGDSLCIVYNKVQFGCKKLPNSTTLKNKELLSMQNEYISEMEELLRKNFGLAYGNSQLQKVFEIYKQQKRAIQSGNEWMVDVMDYEVEAEEFLRKMLGVERMMEMFEFKKS